MSPGTAEMYLSTDVVGNKEEKKFQYPTKRFNSIPVASLLPEHFLPLKQGKMVKILRNLQAKMGDIKGTQ